jgi:thiol-disulfide isomerase/thioredoxin
MVKNEKDKNEKSFRKISKDKYIVAGVITLLIFSLGLTLGFILEDYRYNIVEEINTEQEVNYLSLQMQYLYLDVFSNHNNCAILSTTLKGTVEDLDESLSKVIAYEEESESDDVKKTLIMRRYALDNLRYWLLAKESKDKCQLDIVPILYFYSSECPSCPNQGTILTYFKKKFGKQVLVFPINLDLRKEEPMVEITMKQFEISQYPTLLINNKKFAGVVGKEQLEKVICSSLKNSEHCS